MNKIRVQLLHDQFISKEEISLPLFDEIGEENNLSEEDISTLFDIEQRISTPGELFITIFCFEFPIIEVRETSQVDIINSYLKSLKDYESIQSVVKLHDGFMFQDAERYYSEIIDLEMDLRNLMSYILAYDNREIDQELFKAFDIKQSEALNVNKMQDKYENGLFYIYFNHYASFLNPANIKQDKFVRMINDPSIQSFEDLREMINNRGIKETRHIEFLTSIKTKIDPVEKMRNCIMHIRNISTTLVANYKKAIYDEVNATGEIVEKGIKSKIVDFWVNESICTAENSWFAMVNDLIERVVNIVDKDGGYDIAVNFDEVEEIYETIEEMESDLKEYLEEKIDIWGIHDLIEDYDNKLSSLVHETITHMTLKEE